MHSSRCSDPLARDVRLLNYLHLSVFIRRQAPNSLYALNDLSVRLDCHGFHESAHRLRHGAWECGSSGWRSSAASISYANPGHSLKNAVISSAGPLATFDANRHIFFVSYLGRPAIAFAFVSLLLGIIDLANPSSTRTNKPNESAGRSFRLKPPSALRYQVVNPPTPTRHPHSDALRQTTGRLRTHGVPSIRQPTD